MRIRLLYKNVRDKWVQLNLFDSQSSDPSIRHREILSTRLYIILLLTFFIIVTTYISITNRHETKTVSFPDYSLYKNLQKKHSDSLQCSCTEYVILYKYFVEINASFHQVCSSDFISQRWIDFIFQVDSTTIYPIDIRTSLSAMWQIIRNLCQRSAATMIDTLKQFNESALINPILLTEDFLETKIQSALHSLLEMISSDLVQSILVVNKMAHANQLMTALSTNSIPITKEYQPTEQLADVFHLPTMSISTYVGVFENIFIQKDSTKSCSCKNNVSCPLPGSIYFYNISQKLGVYDLNQIQSKETLPGLIVDCLPIQTTFLSTLECFYNRTCLNRLLSFYLKQINVTVLNQFVPSRFNQTTKIEFLLNELFIEEVHFKINYNKYYFQCKPSLCHYIQRHRFNSIYILTTLFGLLGGLTAVLRFITPYFIQLMLSLQKRFCSKRSQAVRQSQGNI
ncbi:unnamed protein product [Adineta ricciae]|uniref:Uncharacterized protein n=1 Tax=Adineta ricciae TaxID=249248 RepID=A0A816ADV7_ADIRI|nr:unnamed protein product [Adineta ricciae]CAF1596369.1 unnamed protein product [Adineta ricciae]